MVDLKDRSRGDLVHSHCRNKNVVLSKIPDNETSREKSQTTDKHLPQWR